MSLIGKVVVFKHPDTKAKERGIVLEKYYHYPSDHYIVTSKGKTIHIEPDHVLEVEHKESIVNYPK